MIKRGIAVAAIVAAAGVLGVAAPALAQNPPANYPNGQNVSASLTVAETLSLTLNNTTMTLTGSPATGTTTYSVSTNSTDGYNVNVMDTGFGSGFPDLSVTDTGNGGLSGKMVNQVSNTVIADANTASGASGDAHSDAYSETIPANVAPGTYTDQITYSVFAGG